MFSKIKKSSLFLVILLLASSSNLFQGILAFGQEIKKVPLEKLYKSGAIDLGKLLSDDTIYLRMGTLREDIFYLKKGKENKPFSLNIKTLDIEVISEKVWLLCQDERIAPYFEPGGYLEDNGILRNIYTKQVIKPSGNYILEHTVSPSGAKLFVYSFSGYYRKPKGIGIFISSAKKIGRNYFEIWNIEKAEKIFLEYNFSFTRRYWPILLFWLEEKKIIIFSMENEKSLMVIKY